MTNSRNIRRRRALTKRESRVLARFGDQLIEHTRREQPLTLWVTHLPTCRDDVDVRIRAARSGKPFRANFNGGNYKGDIAIRLQVTNQKVSDSALEIRPAPVSS
jgi:hypothetical protein